MVKVHELGVMNSFSAQSKSTKITNQNEDVFTQYNKDMSVQDKQVVAKPKETPKFEEYSEKKFGNYDNYMKKMSQYYFKNDLKNGKLKLVEPTKIEALGFKLELGDSYYTYQTSKDETLGDIKERYNLGDGYIGNQSAGGGGNFDKLKALPFVDIKAEAFKDNGLIK